MKIRCDVCEKEEASVFCSADEAALCSGCDHRVHFANKLASKHFRFALIQPYSKQHDQDSTSPPLCDICQERRAFLFCQQDRAILCRECDVPIHKANEQTKTHNRFLLTGVKLSSTYSSSSNISDHQTNNNNNNKTNKLQSQSSSRKKSKSNEIFSSPSSCETKSPASPVPNTTSNVSDTRSSISEYLIETLPGWRVDDFLDPSNPNGYSKTGVSFYAFGDNQDVQTSTSTSTSTTTSTSSFSLEECDFPPWASQVFPETNQVPLYLPSQNGLTHCTDKTAEEKKVKLTQKSRSTNNAFAVPQFSSSSSGNSLRHIC